MGKETVLGGEEAEQRKKYKSALSRLPTSCGLAVLRRLNSGFPDTLKNDESHQGHLLVWVMSFMFTVLEVKTNNFKICYSFLKCHKVIACDFL